jgi:hypothetical protein
MLDPVDTRNPNEVESQVRSIYCKMYPDADQGFVPRAFAWAAECFSGRYADYQPIDARYHDFEHTLQGTLCLTRLLRGRQAAGAKPEVPLRQFELALLAILFHDTGYLKKRDDVEGTGAKYTVTHVARSADFADEFLQKQGYAREAIDAIRNMISCTGVNAILQRIPFHDELERMLGSALATADLLGQMAARDYVAKLPILHLEFAEAVQHDGRRAARLAAYGTAEELTRHTPTFWQNYVLPRISGDFGGLYRYLNEPYPDGPNPYLWRIEENLASIQQRQQSAQ